MKENLMCKAQKASGQDFRDNFDRTFNHIHPKSGNCKTYNKLIERKLKNTDTPWMPKKEYLPGGMKEFLYPEEIRDREIERKLRKAENA